MSELYAHQVAGVRRIVDATDPWLWLGDEMGAGKTRQAIEAAQVMWERGEVSQVVVVAPAQVARPVWYDPDTGQLAEYLRVRAAVELFHSRHRAWRRGRYDEPGAMEWVVTTYEYVRRPEHESRLAARVGPSTMLVLDESLAVKTPSADTTRAIWRLRRRCGRVLLLNGTEGGGDTPGDLYAQAKMMSPDVLGCKTWYEFRARYARLEPRVLRDGRRFQEIVGWVNLNDLWRRLGLYYVRRTKAECVDLPAKLPPVATEVPLSRDTWRLYREMRDDAVSWLSANRQASAAQAGVRALRLAQLCGGVVGGAVDVDPSTGEETAAGAQVVGDEKVRAVAEWGRERAREGLRCVVWCRFRSEAERAAAALEDVAPTRLMVGGQPASERADALAWMDPRSAPAAPGFLVGTVRSGALGVNLAAASAVAYLSNDHSHVARTQSEDRVHRPGQTRPVTYHDFLACGPDGQRTVDHAVMRALRAKLDVARWRAREWMEALADEG